MTKRIRVHVRVRDRLGDKKLETKLADAALTAYCECRKLNPDEPGLVAAAIPQMVRYIQSASKETYDTGIYKADPMSTKRATEAWRILRDAGLAE